MSWEKEGEYLKKHIVCFGDSNTYGYCADPADSADGLQRFNEEERWTCRLQSAVGNRFLVIEEGLPGRTTVFPDPLHEAMDGLSAAYPILMTHCPVDLLIILLGTNDTKERFGVSAAGIAAGMERLLLKCRSVDCWNGKAPNILVVCPPPIGPEFHDEVMGNGCPEKSAALAPYLADTARRCGANFFDAAECEFNSVDHMHFSRKGHAQLAEKLAGLVPELLKD